MPVGASGARWGLSIDSLQRRFGLEHRAGQTSVSPSMQMTQKERFEGRRPGLPTCGISPLLHSHILLILQDHPPGSSVLYEAITRLLRHRFSLPALNSPGRTFPKPFCRAANSCSLTAMQSNLGTPAYFQFDGVGEGDIINNFPRVCNFILNSPSDIYLWWMKTQGHI